MGSKNIAAKEQRQIHEQFSESLMNDSQAKVWVIFGKDNKTWYTDPKTAGNIIELFEFTPDGSSVSTPIALELDERRQVKRVVIFCFHPEAIFYPNDPLKGKSMEQALDLAAALTDMAVEDGYLCQLFATMLKRYENKGNATGEGKKKGSAKPKDVQTRIDGQKVKDSQETATRGQLLRLATDLLELELENADSDDSSSQPLTYRDIGPELCQWLISENVGGEAEADVWRRSFAHGNLTLAAAIQIKLSLDLDTATYKEGQASRHAATRKESKFAAMYRTPDASKGDPLSLQVHCNTCGTVRTDFFPIFMHDGRYIVRRLACEGCPRSTSKSEAGRISKKILWPVDSAMPRVGEKQMRAEFYSLYPDADGTDKHRQMEDRERSRAR
jgi:hypothetical protein